MSSTDSTTLKSNRKACHQARDLFFECYDKSNGNQTKCRLELKEFEKNCPASWVQHFMRKHKFEKYKEELTKEGLLSPDKDAPQRS
jgi:cytochrome c oxidase assembly factor 6